MRDLTRRRRRVGEHLLQGVIYLCAFSTAALVVAMVAFVMVSSPNASQATKDFLDWAVSDEGQEVVTHLKLISIK